MHDFVVFFTLLVLSVSVCEGLVVIPVIISRREFAMGFLDYFLLVSSSSFNVSDDSEYQVNEPSSMSAASSTTTSWTGTELTLRSLSEATATDQKTGKSSPYFSMARWPDPILRRPAQDVDPIWFGTSTLERASQLLSETAQREGAVGLAAQQCGVDGRIVYLQTTTAPARTRHNNKLGKNDMADGGIILVNPQIVARSPEEEMKVWVEECLVLPPAFRATVLRDSWVDVKYFTTQGEARLRRFHGEKSRCIQHELDHDRGILITDHISLEEMENDTMRQIEAHGHDERMILAYSRHVVSSS